MREGVEVGSTPFFVHSGVICICVQTINHLPLLKIIFLLNIKTKPVYEKTTQNQKMIIKIKK